MKKRSYSIMNYGYLLVVLSVIYSSGLCEAIGDRKNVTIINAIREETKLEVHCKSRDDDLGKRVLVKGQSFSFQFKVNYWLTTLFYCRFTWSQDGGIGVRPDGWVSHLFTIFEAKMPQSRCKDCLWNVYAEHICLTVPQVVTCFNWTTSGFVV